MKRLVRVAGCAATAVHEDATCAMKRMAGMSGRLLALIGMAMLFGGASAPAHSADPKEWAVLIFMNGKNDLEEFAIEDFKELAAVGSTSDVDFVVQLGRPQRRPGEQAALKTVFGGWTGARRFHVRTDSTPAPGKEVEIVGAGSDVDMGAPETLASFLKWGKARFPAHRYAVVIWNHGQGYRLLFPAGGTAAATTPAPERAGQGDAGRSHRAVSQDIDTGSIIYNSDLRASLQSAFGSELRLVGFDACLMAMIETAYELRDVAPVMVASEELEPGNGWDYTRVARYLTRSPKSDEEQLAADLVKSYRETYGDSDNTTLSALKLGGVKALAAEVSALSDALLADRNKLFPVVKAVRAQRGAYNDPKNPVTIDLIGFLNALEPKLAAAAPSTPALTHLRRARELAKSLVLANYTSAKRSGHYGSHGIAIYFPISKAAFNRDGWSDGYVRSNQFKKIDFVATESWSAFLQAYLGLPP